MTTDHLPPMATPSRMSGAPQLPNELLDMIVKCTTDAPTLRTLRRVSKACSKEADRLSLHTITKQHFPHSFHDLYMLANSPSAHMVRKVVVTEPQTDAGWPTIPPGNWILDAWALGLLDREATRPLLGHALIRFKNLEEIEFQITPHTPDTNASEAHWRHLEATLRHLQGVRAKRISLVTKCTSMAYWFTKYTRQNAWFDHNFVENRVVTLYANPIDEVLCKYDQTYQTRSRYTYISISGVGGTSLLDLSWAVRHELQQLRLESLRLEEVELYVRDLAKILDHQSPHLKKLEIDDIVALGGSWESVFKAVGRCGQLSRVTFFDLGNDLEHSNIGKGVGINILAEAPSRVFSDEFLYLNDSFALGEMLRLLKADAKRSKRHFSFNSECERFFTYPSVQEYQTGEKTIPHEDLDLRLVPYLTARTHLD